MSVTRIVRRTASTTQTAVLLLLPHGGQRVARSNAWASMSADAVRARGRQEAAAAMSRAVALHPGALQVAAGG